jgi:hypothetical protein
VTTKSANPKVIVLKNLIRYDDGKRSSVEVRIESSKPFNAVNAKGATAVVNGFADVRSMAVREALAIKAVLGKLQPSI